MPNYNEKYQENAKLLRKIVPCTPLFFDFYCIFITKYFLDQCFLKNLNIFFLKTKNKFYFININI